MLILGCQAQNVHTGYPIPKQINEAQSKNGTKKRLLKAPLRLVFFAALLRNRCLYHRVPGDLFQTTVNHDQNEEPADHD